MFMPIASGLTQLILQLGMQISNRVLRDSAVFRSNLRVSGIMRSADDDPQVFKRMKSELPEFPKFPNFP